ncbi:hypothetical protein JHK87_010152 [Glycine soja]|nr:hypothetical protein JHK87_010152 [Glycine soja]
MGNLVDQDQQWLLSCLSTTLDPNPEVRSVVLLKQFVKKHWQEGEDSFEPPVVASDEKLMSTSCYIFSPLSFRSAGFFFSLDKDVGCLKEFIQNFSSLFTSEFEVYEKVSIEGTEDSHEGRYDFDGSEKSLDSFVIQFMAMPAFANICQLGDILQNMLFALMLTIVGNPRLGKIPPPGRSFAPKQTDAPMSVARSLQNVMAGVRGSLDATTLRLESYKTNGSEF